MKNKSLNRSETLYNPLVVEVQELYDNRIIFAAGGESLTFVGQLFTATADGKFRCTHDLATEPFAIFSAELQAEENIFLSEVQWLSGKFEENAEHVVHSTNLSDGFVCVRKNGISFIFSLDFPYSKIDGCQISYKPYIALKSGQKYTPHSVTVTACRLSGKMSGKFDIAEIEAVSDYIENRYPIRFDRPMNMTTGITNRMTYVEDGKIFYSMDDNATLELKYDLTLEDVDLCAELGLEYYQVFEGVFDWVDTEKNSQKLKALVDYAAEKGVKVGDYVHPGEMYCPHYNYEGRFCGETDWRSISAEGNYGQLCLGSEDYLKHLKERLVTHNKKHKEKLICMDMLMVGPCYNEKHNHAPGDVYKQVLGMVELMEALNALSDDYMVWTNSGNWIEFMPKLAWYNQNIYLTDPHAREYEPALNALKYYGDCRREQMVTVHEKYMLPYRFFTNCEYYFCPRGRVSDVRTYEYSLLQSLAVTPNVCLGEIRTFVNRIPYKEVAGFKRFIKKWLNFVKDNYRYWKKTLRCGDAPGVGAAELYSHIDGDTGYLCFVNQNTYSMPIKFRLDQSVGLMKGDRIELSEIYPKECLLAEAGIPYAQYGDEIELLMEPESVRYIKVEPYTETAGIAIYGAEGRTEKTENGYRIYLKEEQGVTKSIAISVDKDERILSLNAYQMPTVKMYTFDVEANITCQAANLARAEIKFPRFPAVKEISSWTREADGQKVTLPRPGFEFMGGLVSGSYSEKYEVCVEIVTAKNEAPQVSYIEAVKGEAVPQTELKHNKTEKLSTEFYIPFIEPIHFPSKAGFDDDSVMHLVFRDPAKVVKLKAWLNGTEVEVKQYKHVVQRGWFTYYVELTGNVNPGAVKMSLEIEWAEG